MYPPMEVPETGDGELAVKEAYRLRPMNCPHHHKIFAAEPRSYRDLPLRLAEYGQVYRWEESGAVSGLLRVRGMSMNDAHIYCTPEQIKFRVHGRDGHVSAGLRDSGAGRLRGAPVALGPGRPQGKAEVRRQRASLGTLGADPAGSARGDGCRLRGGQGRGGLLRAQDRYSARHRHRPGRVALNRATRLLAAGSAGPGLYRRRRRRAHAVLHSSRAPEYP